MSDLVIDVLAHCVTTGATVMAPILLTGLVIGVSVGALQAATQVNEPTLTFVPKVLGVGLVTALLLPWGLDRFVSMFRFVVERFRDVGAG
jgi:flagellar biosynthetic protein FliQ